MYFKLKYEQEVKLQHCASIQTFRTATVCMCCDSQHMCNEEGHMQHRATRPIHLSGALQDSKVAKRWTSSDSKRRTALAEPHSRLLLQCVLQCVAMCNRMKVEHFEVEYEWLCAALAELLNRLCSLHLSQLAYPTPHSCSCDLLTLSHTVCGM